MSGKVVGWAMEQSTGSPTTKLVLVKLADNANEEGICWPSKELIAEHTELSPRSVETHLIQLEKLGLVRVERRSQGKVHLPNIYHLAVPAASRKPKKVPQDVRHQTSTAPDAVLPQADGEKNTPNAGPVPQDVRTHIEEPPLEPSKEPSLSANVGKSADARQSDTPRLEFNSVFEEFRGWPGAEAHWSEDLAFDAWTALGTDRPSASIMKICVRLHGVQISEENARRRASGGKPRWPQYPENWLKQKRYKGYIAKAESAVLASLDTAASRPRTLDEPTIQALLSAGLSQGQVDGYLSGATFEIGPPPTLRQPSAFLATKLNETHVARMLRAALGQDLIITDKPKKAASAA